MKLILNYLKRKFIGINKNSIKSFLNKKGKQFIVSIWWELKSGMKIINLNEYKEFIDIDGPLSEGIILFEEWSEKEFYKIHEANKEMQEELQIDEDDDDDMEHCIEEDTIWFNTWWWFMVFTYGVSMHFPKPLFVIPTQEMAFIFLFNWDCKLPIFFVESGHCTLGRLILIIGLWFSNFINYHGSVPKNKRKTLLYSLPYIWLFAINEYIYWYFEEMSYYCVNEIFGFLPTITLMICLAWCNEIEWASENDYGFPKYSDEDDEANALWKKAETPTIEDDEEPYYRTDFHLNNQRLYVFLIIISYAFIPIADLIILDMYMGIDTWKLSENPKVNLFKPIDEFVKTYCNFNDRYKLKPLDMVFNRYSDCPIHMYSFPHIWPQMAPWNVKLNQYDYPLRRSRTMWVGQQFWWNMPSYSDLPSKDSKLMNGVSNLTKSELIENGLLLRTNFFGNIKKHKGLKSYIGL